MSASPQMQVEKVLDDLIHRLANNEITPESKAALIEAKRLRAVTLRWVAIPPPPDARREMLARVMELIAAVNGAAGKSLRKTTSLAPRGNDRGMERETQPIISDRPTQPAPPGATDLANTSASVPPAPRVPGKAATVPELRPLPRRPTPPPLPAAQAPSFRPRAATPPPLPRPTSDSFAPRTARVATPPPLAKSASVPPPLPTRQATTRPPPKGNRNSFEDLTAELAQVIAAPDESGSPEGGFLAVPAGGPLSTRSTPPNSSRTPPPSARTPAPNAVRSSEPIGPPSSGRTLTRPLTLRPPAVPAPVLKESEPISQAETKRAPIIQPTQGETGIDGLSRTISSARSPQVRATPQPPRALRETIVEGVSVVRPDAADWQPHPLVGGVVVKLLFRDPESGRYTALIRIAPGTSLPPRLHAGYEEMLVIAGTAVVGESEIRAAEYCRAEPGSTHPAIATATGCTLFVSGSELDEVLPNNT